MITLHQIASLENFDEQAYLDGNPDVQDLVTTGKHLSGLDHFNSTGFTQNRKLSHRHSDAFLKAKKRKLESIRKILRTDLPCIESENSLDYLTPDIREEFSIIDTNLVSSNDYDPNFLEVINNNELVLDCGAGSRSTYYANVVNFEIVDYPSTDVLGVGEILPFKDASFDAVLSSAVLEHVKDPWRCAQEISRVLKPGGELICCVPFLQPLHGYPHHYYNMSHQGLSNLFSHSIDVSDHYVPASTLPIWTLSWILNSWSSGLTEETAKTFLEMQVKDLIKSPLEQLNKNFVTELSVEKNFELASATVLRGRKKHSSDKTNS